MEKNKYRIVICIVVFIISVLLSSCAFFKNQASTKISINEDGSGFRLISCKIRPNSLKKQIVGGEEAFDNFIKCNCPEEISFDKHYDDIDLYYDFYIYFDSIEDYKNKISALLSRSTNQSFHIFDNIFAKGISLQEDFSSADLMYWLDGKLTENNLLIGTESLWEYAGNTVSFGGKFYKDLDNNIKLLSLEYSPVDKIEILTTINDDDSFTREISFYISNKVLQKLGRKKVFDYMNLRVPEGDKGEWLSEKGKNYSIFEINLVASDIKSLTEKMNTVLSSKQEKSEKKTEAPMLIPMKNFEEHLDFSSFPSNKSGKTYVNYSVRLSENQNIYSAKKKQNLNWINTESVSNSHEFILNEEMSNLDISLMHGVRRIINTAEVKTQILPMGIYQRDVVLNFGKKSEKENIDSVENIKKYIEKMKLEFVTVLTQDDSCIISIRGSLEDVNSAQKMILGDNNELTITDDKGFQLYNTFTIKDQIDLSKFMSNLGYKNQVKYHISSPNKFTKYSSKDISSSKFYSYMADKNKIELPLDSNGEFYIVSESKSINTSFISVMLVIFLIFVLFIVVFIYFVIYSNRKNTRIKDINLQSEAMPKFLFSGYICPNCHAPLYLDMSYCSLCGQKLKIDQKLK